MTRRLLYAGALVLVLAACGGDGKTLRDPVFGLPAPPETTVPDPLADVPVTGAPIVESTRPAEPPGTSVPRNIVIDRLWSPANATAEIEGIGAVPTDAVTVDGERADVLSFDRAADGAFVAQVRIDDEGAHTVCIADACGRVYTLAADAETPEEVTAKIEQATVDVEAYLDIDAEFPDWSIEVAGALSGTGGSTDVDTRTVTIYRNRGRSVDDFVRTILHEFGHVADFERLTDEERVEYLLLRGLDPKAIWRTAGEHRLDDWARQPSEDFAEAMVMIWSDGRWSPRTDGVGLAPDAAQLAAITELVAPVATR